MTMTPFRAAISVFESDPYWVPELQRQFLHSAVTVRECRSIGDLLPGLEVFDFELILLDFESGPVEALAWLSAFVTKQVRRIPIIICGSSDTRELEWMLREAGVSAFLPDRVSGEDLARLCRRLLGVKRLSGRHDASPIGA